MSGPDPKPPKVVRDPERKPRGPYDRCPGCGDWKAKHAEFCRACSPNVRGSSHYAWKGENAPLATKRARVARAAPLGFCERCGTKATDRYRRDGSVDNDEPANIGQMCRRCLMEYDGRLESLVAQASRAALSQIRRGREIACANCGRIFYEKPSGVLRRKYCSYACKGDATRDSPAERRRKRATQHIPGWSVRTKGETECRNCASDRRLHLHHVIPRGLWRAGRADIRNGIVLCEACHLGWHRREVEISIRLLTSEELAFVISADIGQDVAYWLERHYALA